MVSIAFTGGGTGGHIYPALAVAEVLAKSFPCRLFWIGSNTGRDRAIVEEAALSIAGGIPFYGIPSGKLRRYFSLKNAADPFKVMMGFFAARSILKKEKPALLFSKGGFVSVPPCAAAASLGIPVFSHESDYSPGLATRIVARFAEKIFIPYEETRRFFSGKAQAKLALSGNPVRPEFSRADPAKGRAFLGVKGKERILLALGGSTGAAEVNELVRGSLPALTKTYTVVHQTGGAEEPSMAAPPGCGPGAYLPFRYIKEEMPHVIAAAELVVTRSGAGALWECASLGKPAILIPLRGSTRGDQVENARLFAGSGAAVVMEAGYSREDFEAAVASIALSEAKREAMSRAAAEFANSGRAGKDAASLIAEAILQRTGGASSTWNT